MIITGLWLTGCDDIKSGGTTRNKDAVLPDPGLDNTPKDGIKPPPGSDTSLSDETDDKKKKSEPDPDLQTGIDLYEKHCASCHGILIESTKPNRTVAQIKAAIGSLPSMSHLTILSENDLRNISDALSAPGEEPSDTDDGPALYGKHCASCHNNLAETTKPDASPAAIKTAIQSVNQMKSLSTLTEAEIARIADSLVTSSTQTPGAEGKQLYARHCAGCHGELDISQKKNSSSQSISAAIASVPDMQTLKLSAMEIEAIAVALDDQKPPYQPLLANSYILTARFQHAFGITNADPALKTTFDTLIKEHIGYNESAFSGLCIRHDNNCLPNRADFDNRTQRKLATGMFGRVNASRRGLVINACRKLLSDNSMLSALMQKHGFDASQPPNLSMVPRVTAIFHPTADLTGKVETAVGNLLNKMGSENFSNTDRWRYFILPFCQSTLMEML
jgi:mono/diheme cytochrome c family protein